MRTFLIFMATLAATSAGASAAASGPSVPTAMLTRSGEKPEPLPVVRVAAECRIFGGLAETKTTFTFRNPLDRDYEADFYFRVPDGATVCGYALDIGGAMVDGVVVDRRRATEVYEEIVRRRIDPGLLEWSRGNIFRARVFPLPAKGTRTISVRTVTALADGPEGPRLELPLHFKDRLEELRVRLEVVSPGAPPKIVAGAMPGLEFRRQGDALVAEAVAKDIEPPATIVVTLPGAAQDVLVERAADGQTYFYLKAAPPAAEAAPTAPAASAAPRRVSILWDGSGSRAGSDHAREIGVVRSYLEALGSGDVAVDLVVFRHEAAPPVRFTVKNGQADALLKALAAVEYDGGTQMAAITPAPGAPPPDVVLLFTDGLSTFGSPRAGLLPAPVYAFVIGDAVNRNAVRSLAVRTGGAMFDLDEQTDADIRRAVSRTTCWFLGAEAVGGGVADVYPRTPQAVAGRVTVVGRLTGDRGAVRLRFGWMDGRRKDVMVDVGAGRAAAGGLLRYLWARGKVADLMAAADPDAAAIAAVGTEFGVVTPHTSLIVLESLDQYLQYRIRPPAALADTRKAYDKMTAPPKAAAPAAPSVPAEPGERLQRPMFDEREAAVYALLVPWSLRLTLWSQEFSVAPDFRYKPPAEDVPVSPGGAAAGLVHGAWLWGASTGGGGSVGSLFGGGAAGTLGGGRGMGGTFFGGPEAAAGGGEPPHFPVQDLVDPGPLDFTPPAKPPAPTTDTTEPTEPPAPVAPGRAPADGPPPIRPAKPAELWNPAAPHLKALKAAPPDGAWAAYLQQRPANASSAAFYLDCADFFYAAGQADRGLQVLSNLSELGMAESMRTLAFRLVQTKHPEAAARAFEESLLMCPGDPRSRYDLATALERLGQTDRAITLLHALATRDDGVTTVGLPIMALADLNRLLARAGPEAARRIGLDRRLVRVMDCDLRVVATWDSTAADIDLIVTEPSGERCFYEHGRTEIGGWLWTDPDLTGFPEEYFLRRAMPGVYRIDVQLTENMAPRLATPILVQVEVFTDYGRPAEKRDVFVCPMMRRGRTVKVTEVKFPRPPGTATAESGR